MHVSLVLSLAISVGLVLLGEMWRSALLGPTWRRARFGHVDRIVIRVSAEEFVRGMVEVRQKDIDLRFDEWSVAFTGSRIADAATGSASAAARAGVRRGAAMSDGAL